MLATYILNLGAEIWGKKWRAAVLWHLRCGEEKRFSELKREIHGCSVKVLSEVLRELEQNHLIIRTQYPSIPVKVTYKLHPDYMPMVDSLNAYVDQMGNYFYTRLDKYPFPEEIEAELKKQYGS